MIILQFKIDEYIKRGNVFMAFGAGHLFGPRGVLELLEKKGYKPVRVTPEELANAENEAPAKDDTPSEDKEAEQ